MFQAVGWDLIEGFNEPDAVFDGMSVKLKIIKRHEFDHTRATMSVVIEDSQGAYHVYCKVLIFFFFSAISFLLGVILQISGFYSTCLQGSFEKLQQLCSQESTPKNYLETAQAHALDGCYVLSLGYRFLVALIVACSLVKFFFSESSKVHVTFVFYRSLGNDFTLEDIVGLPRDMLEMKLQFVALIIFRNEPKVDSQVAIKSLKEGEVIYFFCTGGILNVHL